MYYLTVNNSLFSEVLRLPGKGCFVVVNDVAKAYGVWYNREADGDMICKYEDTIT